MTPQGHDGDAEISIAADGFVPDPHGAHDKRRTVFP